MQPPPTPAPIAPQPTASDLTVELAHAPNPDIDGGYWETIPPRGRRRVPVSSIAEASQVCCAFLNQYGLGSGNWAGGSVRQGSKVIARISYNGRAWSPEPYPACTEIPIANPTSADLPEPGPAALPLVFPVPSLNGTPPGELTATANRIRSGVLTMLQAVKNAAPNDRDYYPQGAHAIKLAEDGHHACCEALRRLGAELLAMADDKYRSEIGLSYVAQLTAAVPVTPLATPTIHTNGTSIDGLKTPAITVFRASLSLHEDFRQLSPNARDYDSTDRWVAAREQHVGRLALVKRIGGYYLQLATACRKVPPVEFNALPEVKPAAGAAKPAGRS